MNANVIKLPKIKGLSDLNNRIVKTCGRALRNFEPMFLFILLLIVWSVMPRWLHMEAEAASINESIWLLIVVSMIAFLAICAITWWLMQQFWLRLGLPQIQQMVSQFNTLTSWQQLSLFSLYFVSVLLAALGCLIAIC